MPDNGVPFFENSNDVCLDFIHNGNHKWWIPWLIILDNVLGIMGCNCCWRIRRFKMIYYIKKPAFRIDKRILHGFEQHQICWKRIFLEIWCKNRSLFIIINWQLLISNSDLIARILTRFLATSIWIGTICITARICTVACLSVT